MALKLTGVSGVGGGCGGYRAVKAAISSTAFGHPFVDVVIVVHDKEIASEVQYFKISVTVNYVCIFSEKVGNSFALYWAGRPHVTKVL